ncbi:MAG: GIY-YIG nuclease family protein [Actinomycetota bacterium]
MDKKRRKDLVRGCWGALRPMGVYGVYCLATGRGVVGPSQDLPSALNRQHARLSLGTHPGTVLQGDWDRRGSAAFEFGVLDALEPGNDPGYDPSGDLEELARVWRERVAFGADPQATPPSRDEWDSV